MPLPSDRFRRAGATAEEITELEAQHDALRAAEQLAEEERLAGVDDVALIGILEELRAPAAGDDGLDDLKREELDEVARKVGVEEPDKLKTKGDVIDAIRAAQEPEPVEGGGEAGEGEGSPVDGDSGAAGGA